MKSCNPPLFRVIAAFQDPAPCRRFAFRQNKKSLSAGCSESTPPKGFFAQDKHLFATNVLEDDYST
jgi:hypothetical protein